MLYSISIKYLGICKLFTNTFDFLKKTLLFMFISSLAYERNS